MKYRDWPESKVSVGSLFLDPFNPRFPDEKNRKNQGEIISELVEDYNVEKIATLIAINGYFPTEALIVYEDDGKKYVIEGNRRTVACKLLLNPDLAPEKHRNKFKKLAEKVDLEEIRKLKVVIAPSREKAIPILVRKHTKSSVEPWDPIAQTKFYISLLEQGFTAEQLHSEFDIPMSEIKKALTTDELYEAAKTIEFPEEIKKIIHDEQKFSITTVGRVMQTAKAKEFFGIDIDGNGNINLQVPKEEFFKGYKKLIEDIATGKENSRTLNNAKNIESYLEKFSKDEKPNISKKEADKPLSKVIEEVKAQSSGSATTNPSPKPPKNNSPRPANPKYLIPIDFKSSIKNDKLQNLILELKRLPVKEFPNCCALALRQLLELGTYLFLEELGELTKWDSEIRSKGQKPSSTFPELRQSLLRIIQKELINDRDVLKALNLWINDSSTSPLLHQLNNFVHNQTFHPSTEHLRNIWLNFQDYFKIILKTDKSA